MSFDPQTFMTAVTDAANDTKVILCPPGEYLALTGEPKVEEGTSSKDGRTFYVLRVPIFIDDPQVTGVTGRAPTQLRYEAFLDLSEDGTSLDNSKGKNIGLGRIREACGCNVPGQPFSIPNLGGKVIKVSVAHRMDKNDASKIYDFVKAVAPK